MNKEKEVRQLVAHKLETRAEGEALHIEGYIVKYNENSEYMGFFEQISPGAFDNALASRDFIPMLLGHDSNKIMGSTRSGSLKLTSDAVGLRFDIELNPSISYNRDAFELVKSGDLKNCSFGFFCEKSDWGYTDDGVDLRKITIADVYEVSLVPFPAYSQSSAEARCADYENKKNEETRMKQLELTKSKLLIELDL